MVAKSRFTLSVGNAVYTSPGLDATGDFDISGNGAKIHMVSIDCTANTGEDVTVRFYNSTAPTVGTDDAMMALKGKAGEVTVYKVPPSDIWVAPNGLSLAAVQEDGAGAGATSPSGTVDVEMVITEGS